MCPPEVEAPWLCGPLASLKLTHTKPTGVDERQSVGLSVLALDQNRERWAGSGRERGDKLMER